MNGHLALRGSSLYSEHTLIVLCTQNVRFHSGNKNSYWFCSEQKSHTFWCCECLLSDLCMISLHLFGFLWVHFADVGVPMGKNAVSLQFCIALETGLRHASTQLHSGQRQRQNCLISQRHQGCSSRHSISQWTSSCSGLTSARSLFVVMKVGRRMRVVDTRSWFPWCRQKGIYNFCNKLDKRTPSSNNDLALVSLFFYLATWQWPVWWLHHFFAISVFLCFLLGMLQCFPQRDARFCYHVKIHGLLSALCHSKHINTADSNNNISLWDIFAPYKCVWPFWTDDSVFDKLHWISRGTDWEEWEPFSRHMPIVTQSCQTCRLHHFLINFLWLGLFQRGWTLRCGYGLAFSESCVDFRKSNFVVSDKHTAAECVVVSCGPAGQPHRADFYSFCG